MDVHVTGPDMLKLDEDPTEEFRKELMHALEAMKPVMNDITYKKLLPAASKPPRLFGYVKIHKEGNPTRPIVTGRESICDGLSKYMSAVLLQVTGNTKHNVRDSMHLKYIVQDLIIPEGYILISCDVTALYPQTPRTRLLRVSAVT